VVARPCEARWVLVVLWYSVCGPVAAWGAQGEEKYPYCWLEGTGEVTSIEKWELNGAHAGQRLRVVALGYGTYTFIFEW
jgi:hypothetical protein